MYNKIKSNSLLVWALVVIFLAAIAVGDDAEPGATETDDSQATSNIEIQDGATDTDSATIQSINFQKNVEIRDALKFLAARYHKNIIPSANVAGTLTVSSLYDVTFEQAMDAILGYGFKCKSEGNFIYVYTAEEYAKIRADKSRMEYKVFTLYYIAAAEARKLIAPVLSANGVIEATSAAIKGVPTSESITSTTGEGGDSVAMNDTIIVYDYPENIVKAEDVIASVDIRPKQVLIEATIMAITLTEGMQFGIDWQTLAETGISPFPPTGIGDLTKRAADYYSSSGTGVKTGTSSLTGGMTVGFTHDNISAFIRAVEETTDVTVLANPKILAVNKQLGQVYIGNKIGYISQESISDGGTSTAQISFMDTGTKLSFRPYIGNDGYIRIDIHPKDSSGSVEASPGGGTTALPTETSAELVTNIIVKDGETIVIGGLFRDQVTAKKSQIPLLGDLPLLGSLFSGRADSVVRQEVVILLTPHIINEPSEVEGYARAEDVSRKRAGAKDELHSISRARLAEDRYANAARYYLEGDMNTALKEVESSLVLRPSYLEALRLKERIIGETEPDGTAGLERKVLEKVEQEDSKKWHRR